MKFEVETKYEIGDLVYSWMFYKGYEKDSNQLSLLTYSISKIAIDNEGEDDRKLRVFFICKENEYSWFESYPEESIFKTEEEALQSFFEEHPNFKFGEECDRRFYYMRKTWELIGVRE